MSPLVSQAQDSTSPENADDTRMITNFKDRTITLLNTTTNEIISVRPFPEDIGNTTTNQTLSGIAENTTTNQTLSGIAENTTTNQTLSGGARNMTSSEFLAEKFRELGNNSVG
jgi:hypothetical protein